MANGMAQLPTPMHSGINPDHPLLPAVETVLDAQELQQWGQLRHEAYRLSCLRYAQSLWRQGLPARALLALNQSLSFPLTRPQGHQVQGPPLPYAAIAWVLRERPAGQFIGNPRRHWQHLATRVRGEHKALRQWRAWACWHLAERLLPLHEFPPDAQQVAAENLAEPDSRCVAEALAELGEPGESLLWLQTLQSLRPTRAAAEPLRIEVLGPQELPRITELAHRIWPVVYAHILSDAQIFYMLKQGYDPVLLQAQQRQGALHALICRGEGSTIGFLSMQALDADQAFLHKLYLDPRDQGLGLGAAALQWCREQASQWGCREISLRVNRHNHLAIRAYLRAGWRISGQVCSDIGAGFVMDDHLMTCSLSSPCL